MCLMCTFGCGGRVGPLRSERSWLQRTVADVSSRHRTSRTRADHHRRRRPAQAARYSPNSTWLVTSRHDTTRHVRYVEPMHFAVSSLSNRTARRARHDERDRRDSQLSLLCNLYKLMICSLSYSLIYWSIHLFNLFHLTEQIGLGCVSVRAQTTTVVRADTIA